MFNKIINLLKRDDAQYYYGMKVDNTPDHQQHEVYAWNNQIGRRDEWLFKLPFPAIVELTKKVCDWYGIEMPVIHTGLLPVPAYDEEGHTLYFLGRGSTIMNVVHELAHVVCVDKYGTDVEGHGPEYVQCFIDVLSYLRGEPKDELILSAYRFGLSMKGEKPVQVQSVWFDEWAEISQRTYKDLDLPF